ncbi:MAG: hypothetical protein M1833_006786 [Piccolia ochrophora]|nr:MAG: hypothetical protein M1833_006786 [Piccolia ochrophora]
MEQSPSSPVEQDTPKLNRQQRKNLKKKQKKAFEKQMSVDTGSATTSSAAETGTLGSSETFVGTSSTDNRPATASGSVSSVIQRHSSFLGNPVAAEKSARSSSVPNDISSSEGGQLVLHDSTQDSTSSRPFSFDFSSMQRNDPLMGLSTTVPSFGNEFGAYPAALETHKAAEWSNAIRHGTPEERETYAQVIQKYQPVFEEIPLSQVAWKSLHYQARKEITSLLISKHFGTPITPALLARDSPIFSSAFTSSPIGFVEKKGSLIGPGSTSDVASSLATSSPFSSNTTGVLASKDLNTSADSSPMNYTPTLTAANPTQNTIPASHRINKNNDTVPTPSLHSTVAASESPSTTPTPIRSRNANTSTSDPSKDGETATKSITTTATATTSNIPTSSTPLSASTAAQKDDPQAAEQLNDSETAASTVALKAHLPLPPTVTSSVHDLSAKDAEIERQNQELIELELSHQFEREEKEDEIKAVQERYEALQAQYQAVHDKHEAMQAQHQADNRKLQEQMSAFKAELKAEFNTLRRENEELRHKLARKDSHGEDTDTWETEKRAMESAYTRRVDQLVADNSEEVRTLEQKAEEGLREKQTISATLQEYIRRNEQLGESVDVAEEAFKEQGEELERKRKGMLAQDRLRLAAVKERNEAEDRYDGAKRTIEDQREELQAMKAASDKALKEAQDSRERLASAEAANEEAQALIQDLEAASEELVATRDHLEKLEKEVEDLRAVGAASGPRPDAASSRLDEEMFSGGEELGEDEAGEGEGGEGEGEGGAGVKGGMEMKAVGVQTEDDRGNVPVTFDRWLLLLGGLLLCLFVALGLASWRVARLERATWLAANQLSRDMLMGLRVRQAGPPGHWLWGSSWGQTSGWVARVTYHLEEWLAVDRSLPG